MKLRWSILEQRDAPPAVRLTCCHQHLYGIDRWIDICLTRRHHADDCAKDGDFGGEKTYISHFTNIGGGDMVGKDLPSARFDLGTPIHRTAIKAYHLRLGLELRSEGFGITPVPAIQ